MNPFYVEAPGALVTIQGLHFMHSKAVAIRVVAASGVAIAGVTSFPVLSYDFTGRQEIAFNPNMRTITEAAQRLRDELGIPVREINAPGNTSTLTLAMLKDAG